MLAHNPFFLTAPAYFSVYAVMPAEAGTHP